MNETIVKLVGSVKPHLVIGTQITESRSEVNIKFDQRGEWAANYDASQRTSSHRTAGTAGKYGIDQNTLDRENIDVQGSLVELAVAVYTGHPWRIIRDMVLIDPQTGLKYADVGDRYEAKSVRRDRNSTKRTSLLVHADDEESRIIFLGLVREDSSVSLVGWITAGEARRIGDANPPYLREQSSVWAVPVSKLKPMMEFK